MVGRPEVAAEGHTRNSRSSGGLTPEVRSSGLGPIARQQQVSAARIPATSKLVGLTFVCAEGHGGNMPPSRASLWRRRGFRGAELACFPCLLVFSGVPYCPLLSPIEWR